MLRLASSAGCTYSRCADDLTFSTNKKSIYQMYEDELDGRIDEEFWTRKNNEWREQERNLQSELSVLQASQNGHPPG
jgi:hypothetical protein